MSLRFLFLCFHLSLCFMPLAATPPAGSSTQEQSEVYTCSYCQKTFSRRSNLKRHIEGMHHKRTHPCAQCTKVFKYPNSLQRHVRTIHENHTYDCEQCGQKFINRDDLKVHVSVKHQGKVYPCQDCDKTFATPRNLRAHRDSIHAGKTHACLLCNKSYAHRGSLNNHCTGVHGVTLKSLLQQASGECLATASGDAEISGWVDNTLICAGKGPLDPLMENEPQDISPGLEQDNTGYFQLAGILGQDIDDWMESYLDHTPLTFAPDEDDLAPAPKRPRLTP